VTPPTQPTAGLRQSATTGARWTTVSSVVVTGVYLGKLVILARILGPEPFGLLAMLIIVIGFVELFADLGLADAFIQRPDPTAEQVSTLFWTHLFVGSLATVGIVLMAPAVAWLFGETELRALLPFVACSVLFYSVGSQFYAQLRKGLFFRLLAVIDVAAAIISAVMAVGLAYFADAGVWALAWGVVVGALARSIAYQVFGWRYGVRPGLHFARSDLDGYARFGWFRVGSNIANYFNSRIDQVVIGAMLGPYALGLYNVALNLVRQPLQQVGPIANRIAFPTFAVIQADRERLKRAYLELMRAMMFVIYPLLLGLAVAAPVLIPLVLGPGWDQAVALLRILTIVVIAQTVGYVSGNVTNATGHVAYSFWFNVVLLAVVGPVVWLAARTGEVVMVAVGLALLNVASLVAGYFAYLRRMLGPFARGLAASALPPLVLAFASTIPALAAMAVMSDSSAVLILLIAGSAGAGTYVALAMVFQRAVVMELVQLFRPKLRAG
jgi:lipopolysaccharide exporter